MRRGIVVVLLSSLVTLTAPMVASADHLPPELRFLHRLVRVSTDNPCIDPETLAPAVCHIYRDPNSPALYRVIYWELQITSVWRLGESGPVLIWPRRPDCSRELCA